MYNRFGSHAYFMCNRFGSRQRDGLRLSTRLCAKIRTNNDPRAFNTYTCRGAFSADAMRSFNPYGDRLCSKKASKKSRPKAVVPAVHTAISSKITFYLGTYPPVYRLFSTTRLVRIRTFGASIKTF